MKMTTLDSGSGTGSLVRGSTSLGLGIKASEAQARPVLFFLLPAHPDIELLALVIVDNGLKLSCKPTPMKCFPL